MTVMILNRTPHSSEASENSIQSDQCPKRIFHLEPKTTGVRNQSRQILRNPTAPRDRPTGLSLALQNASPAILMIPQDNPCLSHLHKLEPYLATYCGLYCSHKILLKSFNPQPFTHLRYIYRVLLCIQSYSGQSELNKIPPIIEFIT